MSWSVKLNRRYNRVENKSELETFSMIHVVAAIILRGSRVLLAKRPLNKHQGGKWEFPGGKVNNGESDTDSLIRECQEELNILVKDHKFYRHVEFDYGDKEVCIKFYQVIEFEGDPQGMEGQSIKWFNIESLSKLEFPDANQPVVRYLINDFQNRMPYSF